MLKEMMTQIWEDVETLQWTDGNHSPTHVETMVSSPPCPEESQFHTSNFRNVPPSGTGATDAVPSTAGRRAQSLSLSDVNPPDIWKVVVEHIVRRQDTVPYMQSQVRRCFSGKTPTPNHEADFDTWHTHIELLQNDPSMSPLQVSRKILERVSLLTAFRLSLWYCGRWRGAFCSFLKHPPRPQWETIHFPLSAAVSLQQSNEKRWSETWRGRQAPP